MMTRSRFSLLAASLAILAALGLGGCNPGDAESEAAAPPPPKVVASVPVVKTITRMGCLHRPVCRRRKRGGSCTGERVPDRYSFQGRPAREDGRPALTIDRRPFSIAVASAEADVKVADAALDFARQELKRAAALVTSNNVPERIFEERESGVRQTEARVASAHAVLDRAKLDLEFTEVRAPVSGRIDRHRERGQPDHRRWHECDPAHEHRFSRSNPCRLRRRPERLPAALRAPLAGTRPNSARQREPGCIRLPDVQGFPSAARSTFSPTRSIARVQRSAPAPSSATRISSLRRGSSRACSSKPRQPTRPSPDSGRGHLCRPGGRAWCSSSRTGRPSCATDAHSIVDGLRVVREGFPQATWS